MFSIKKDMYFFLILTSISQKYIESNRKQRWIFLNKNNLENTNELNNVHKLAALRSGEERFEKLDV